MVSAYACAAILETAPRPAPSRPQTLLDLYTHMPMLGVILAIAIMGLTWVAVLFSFSKLLTGVDPAARNGISALVGLGTAGTLTFFIGLFNSTPEISIFVIFILCAAAARIWKPTVEYARESLKVSLPKGIDLLFPLAIGLGLLMALAGVIAPSTMQDWDSIAYHLAVPKLWLEAGKIDVIPFIHQSNFPFAVDSLYMLVMKWGGHAGAKMFVWLYTLIGAVTIFGLARQRYGQRAGWWASLAFTTVPIVLWQSGTSYIDVAHGLYAGLGLIFACWWIESDDSKHAWLSAILLSFAAGTKYTGLQTIAVAGLVALVGAILLKRNLKPVFIIGLASLALASPWYIKNFVWKDNPVFPFFYSKLGGKDWDQRRAEIYTNEQNSFGVGREAPPAGSIQPQRLGHSIIGLAYQPGRYVNPAQTIGRGDPLGAIGIAIIGALMLGMFAGQRGKFERAVIGGVLFSLLIWFVLTQQSRYIVTLAVPLALIAGQLTTRKQFAPLMGGLAVIQAAFSLYLLHSNRFADQMQVVTGKVTPEEFQARGIPLYEPAQEINKLGKNVKVALYDEVFGYVLDVPYVWANPGHSTTIPYDEMQTGVDFAEGMKKLGFTHVLVNMIDNNRADLKPPERVILGQLMHATMAGQPFPEPYRQQIMDNWEVKFKVLIAEAAGAGKLRVEKNFGRPDLPPRFILFSLTP